MVEKSTWELKKKKRTRKAFLCGYDEGRLTTKNDKIYLFRKIKTKQKNSSFQKKKTKITNSKGQEI